MKFSIAFGLLFAGLAHCQLAQFSQASIDGFLRESQHLKPSAELVSIQEHGSIATVTYKDGPVNVKFDVKSDGEDMTIVGIEQVMTFSGNFQFNPSNIPKPTIQIDQLPPLPLLMPHFTVQRNGQLQMRNVFDRVEKQINEIKQKMQQKKRDFQNEMERNFNDAIQGTPLIGGGDHDYNSATAEFQSNPLIGGDDHDILEGKPVDFQAEHPLVGGDDHEKWQNKKKGCHKKSMKNQGLIGGGDHDKWKGGKYKMMKNHHEKHGKQQRHHSNSVWMNKQFTKEEVLPYMTEKLPDLMSGSEILSVDKKGFEKGKGFKLDIQLRDSHGELQNVSVYFKPMKKEFSIEKISKILFGGIGDVEHEVMKAPEEIKVNQDNHISEHVEADLPLPGGKQDPDQSDSKLKEAFNIVEKILRKQKLDIDSVQATSIVNEEKLPQIKKEKLQLLTHRR